jgi:iron complex transport system ATP-binding protein
MRSLRALTDDPIAPMAGEIAVSAAHVTVRRERRAILDDVTLDVFAGEVLALVGPNGAGKSTLLGALAGDLAVDGGSVTLAGRSAFEWSTAAAARVRAVLLQEQMVAFPFLVRDVVAMGRAPWRLTERADDDAAVIASCLADLDIAELAERPVNSLSGGERARVALGRVIAQQTPILLLDEPTAALDLHHQELVFRLARTRAAAGVAVVAVVHDLGLAARHCDRIAVLGAGRLLADGPPAAVLTDALLSQTYGHDVEVIAHPRTGRPIVLPRD